MHIMGCSKNNRPACKNRKIKIVIIYQHIAFHDSFIPAKNTALPWDKRKMLIEPLEFIIKRMLEFHRSRYNKHLIYIIQCFDNFFTVLYNRQVFKKSFLMRIAEHSLFMFRRHNLTEFRTM